MTDSPDPARSLDWRETLFSRRTMGVRLGLDAISKVDAHLGRPGRCAKVVHIVGTNGKGSTAAMVERALAQVSNFSVGLFTSPHLFRVGERVRINGEVCDDEDIRLASQEVALAEAVVDESLSFFEVVTLCALLIFERRGVDIAILEAGLGGRLDSTRVRNPSVTLVARIGIDHQRFLGDTLEEIAGEKAAVLTQGVPSFSVQQHPVAQAVLETYARRNDSPLKQARVSDVVPQGLNGAHQQFNAGLAAEAVCVLCPDVSWRQAVDSMHGVVWPARLETVTVGFHSFIFDACHNSDSVEALTAFLGTMPLAPSQIIFGCLADKAIGPMLKSLTSVGCPVVLVPPSVDGAMHDIPAGYEGCERFASDEDPNFLALWESLRSRDRKTAEGEGPIVVCGSHALVGVLRKSVVDQAPICRSQADPNELIRRD